MKKISIFAFTACLTALFALSAAAADIPRGADGAYAVVYESSGGGYFSLIALRGELEQPPSSIATGDIMALAQGTAQNGRVEFSIIPAENCDCTVFIGGGDLAAPVKIGVIRAYSGVEVSGAVLFAGTSSTAQVELLDPSGKTVYSAVTSTDGAYVISGVASGTYSLKVTKAGYLSYTRTGVEIGASDVAAAAVDMRKLGGDLNASGQVTIEDLSILFIDFNKSSGLVNANSDLNGNGQVTVEDLSILVAGYNNRDVVE